jgi:hypothetical protein
MKVGGTKIEREQPVGDGRERARRPQAEGALAPGLRRRRPSLARILRTAKQQGCDRVVIDDRIVIMLGPAGEVQSKRNPWDEVLIDAADEERSA